jgi:hypothetical protein
VVQAIRLPELGKQAGRPHNKDAARARHRETGTIEAAGDGIAMVTAKLVLRAAPPN